MTLKIGRSVLLYCIHYYLLNKADKNRQIQRKELTKWLGIGFHIPKEKQHRVVNEMERLGIINKLNRDTYQIQVLKE